MTNGSDDRTAPSPDEAFAALGNETRTEILRVLGEVDEPLSFSTLRDRVGMRDSGQFNYHLEKLVGHFLERTDDGYVLRRAGERIVEAVLSGAVTEAPVLEPTRIEYPCPYCGEPTGVRYEEERLELYCTECPGAYGERDDGRGHLGTLYLPPAGLEGRTASELYRAARVWGGLSTVAAANGVCPRCSAAVDESIDVCTDHDAEGSVCEACGGRYAIGIRFECTNCIYERGGMFGVKLLTNTEVLAFMTSRGINPVVSSSHRGYGEATEYDEEVVSVEPFEARFTFEVDGDALTVTVNDDREVVDASRAVSSGNGRNDGSPEDRTGGSEG